MRPSKKIGKIAVLVALAVSPYALGQRVHLATEPEPHFVGEPIVLRITLTGFDEEPQPEIEMVKQPDEGVSVRLVGISPNVSESVTIINGRVNRTRRVQFNFNYEILAEKSGRYSIGPFVVSQGGQNEKVRAASFRFENMETDESMRVGLELTSTGNIYVGQRVPVIITWAYAGDLRDVRQLRIHSPLFDQFGFLDQPTRQDVHALPIVTPKGQVELPAEAVERVIGGQRFIVYTAKRDLITDRPGPYELGPITASMRRDTARSRDPFDAFEDFGIFSSRRRSSKTVPVRAVGKPLSFEVKPLPTERRPASFAGAVGEGFRIDVQADSSFVRVGDPIALTVRLQGKGNLTEAGLPPLSADEGFNTDQFRLPTNSPTGELRDNAKEFHVTVRVTDPNVSQIPALAYSWFDPEQEQYVTTRSDPIALNVQDARVVSSGDVVSGAKVNHDSPTKRNGSQTREESSDNVADEPRRLSLTGADLALELSEKRLLNTSSDRLKHLSIPYVCYGSGILLMVIASIDRRRRNVDPDLLRKRKVIRDQTKRIKTAGNRPVGEAADEIAAALRSLRVYGSHSTQKETDALVAQLETLIYSPNGSGSKPLDHRVVDEAKNIAKEISESS